ncbi:MAG: HlyD family efflux transporter periplasmic adaptor subunit [Planctomycetota bacterium]
MIRVSSVLLFASIVCCTAIGCGGGGADAPVVKRPRPVATQTLVARSAPSTALVAASVASWKTEQIGFEVGGRVEWVTEKNASIEGQVVAPNGETLVEGTPIARLDDEPYQLDYEIAKADLSRAEQQVESTTISVEKTLPARLRAAEADRKLAEIEVTRSRRLVQTNAIAQSELDADEAEYASAFSQVEQLIAEIRSTEADLVADRLKVAQAQQSLRDAERNLENCTLYSSFRGQIADVAVVPGSVVTNGSEVATIQMMNPIKIEFEVSASESRRLARRQQLRFFATNEQGEPQPMEALIYQIDPVADQETRTFTVELLSMNEPISGAGSGDGGTTAIIEKAWRTDLDFLPGAEPGSNFVIAESIESDDQGDYIWRIDNYRRGDVLPESRVLSVGRLPVRRVGQPIPFLGEFMFQQFEFSDAAYDPSRDLVTGPLTFVGGDRASWNEADVVVERSGRWLLRPGDLVQVDLSGASGGDGFYVPMDAISYSEERTFLFFAEPSDGGGHVARRVEVAVSETTDARGASSFRAVTPVGDQSLAGRRLITQGVHYLIDGEPVRPVRGGGAG